MPPCPKYRVFIDDERFPAKGEFVVCRSMQEFVEIVKEYGFPSFISFDHDLGENVPTGMDIAKWIVDLDIEKSVIPPDFDFYVHSMNPVGAGNIQSLLDNYIEFKKSRA